MRVLITGAAGRLGVQACSALADAGHDLVATDVKAARVAMPVTLHEANLLDLAAVTQLMRGAEAVVHLGNHIGMGRRPGAQTFNENVTMNMNVFQSALEAGVRKIVFASSVQVVASESKERHYPPFAKHVAYLPLDADSPPNPGNPYALSKSVGETMLRQYISPHGISCVSLRLPKLLADAEFDGRREWSVDGEFTDSRITQGFSILAYHDAATAVEATIRTPLPGYHVFFPAVSQATGDRVKPAIERFYANVQLRRPAGEIESLVDHSALTQATGWTPRFVI